MYNTFVVAWHNLLMELTDSLLRCTVGLMFVLNTKCVIQAKTDHMSRAATVLTTQIAVEHTLT